MRSIAMFALAWLALGANTPALAQNATPAVASNIPAEIDALLREPSDRGWVVRSLDLAGLGFVDIEVEPVEVFDPRAAVILDGGRASASPPPIRFMRGRIANLPGSVVALSLKDDGSMSGMMTNGDMIWGIGRASRAQSLLAREIESLEAVPRPFACGQEHLPDPRHRDAASSLTPMTAVAALPAGQYYRVKVAIETDQAFYQLFGSQAAALEYIGNLFNYISGIYESQIQTRFLVGDVFLWPTSDPWRENDSTYCRLLEFGKYWQANRGGVDRTIAHFLSGSDLNGGIAWLDALCAAPWSSSESTGCATLGSMAVGGDFGLSAGLEGTFQNSSGIAWDGDVVAHEIGHNFGSRHSHCYGGTEGVSSPVDACYNRESGTGCWSGATSLPGIGSLTGGAANGRNATIMSYCQQLPGGIQNIAATFGIGHPYGIRADRIANLMSTRVAETAASNPACIPIVGGVPTTYTLNVASAGAAGAAIAATPATYGGTTDYSKTGIPAGTAVTLTAPATAGTASFSAWTGCDTTSVANRTCDLVLNANRTVTASYDTSASERVVTVSGVAGAGGSARHFRIRIPDGRSQLTVRTQGVSGEVDLYVRRGTAATTAVFDCRSAMPGPNETCVLNTPVGGDYYLLLQAGTAYTDLTLLVIWPQP